MAAYGEMQVTLGFCRTNLIFGISSVPSSFPSRDQPSKGPTPISRVNSLLYCQPGDPPCKLFQIDEVLKAIFKSLRWSDLQQCRVISRQWNRLATRIIVDSGFIVLPSYSNDRYSTLQQFNNYLTSLCIKIRNVKINYISEVQILKDLNLIGPSTRILRYFPAPLDTDRYQFIPIDYYKILITQLTQLLVQLPNLVSLITDHLPPPPLSPDEDLRDANGNWSWDFEPFIRKLETLKEIRLNHFSLSQLKLYETIQKKIILTQNINVQDSASKFLNIYRKSGLRFDRDIKSIRLTLHQKDCLSVVRNFLDSFSNTIHDLSIVFEGSFTNIPQLSEETWLDNWYLPWTLHTLQRLMIVQDGRHFEEEEEDNDGHWNDKSVVMRTILAAMQLPNLKCLYFESDDMMSIDDFWKNWTQGGQHHLVDNCKFLLLDKLTVYNVQHFKDDSIFRSSFNFFPKLTQLELFWISPDDPGPSILKFVFSDLRLQLVVLRLKLVSWRASSRERRNFNWNNILTGYNSKDQLANSSKQQESTTPNYFLKDMMALKNLSIVFGYEHKQGSVGDSLIYNGLIHLKNLEELQVKNEKFSNKALRDLQETLGLDVKIRINESSSTMELFNFN